MLKSIEKLRDRYYKPGYKGEPTLEQIAGAIEREVSERYMELPKDADGVPWHIGDVTENGNTVNAITFDRFGAHFTSTLNDIDPSIHTHAKPRTVEDVLRDVWKEALDYAKSDMWRSPDEVFAERADELREMLESDVK